MDQPDWSRQPGDPDEQKTVLSDSESVTPPTLPLGDDEGGWQRPAGGGFVRAEPAAPTPPPAGADVGAHRNAPVREPPQDQTMLISERRVPVFAWLAVVDCPDRGAIGTIHTLHPDTTTIGRVPGNTIVLPDDTVSAQHARIRREEGDDGEPIFAIFDMGSRNGIYAGDEDTYRDDDSRVYRHELQDGDHLLVGETTLVFKRI
jgi:hypothetical protein